ncbi:Ig-like domain-containing protein [Brevibacillus borstelensis]|uniref:Ig-like domain-containing protein n=1 Tax=Brevibacillus borstelensis TaxID=45462 RepID=UPI002E1DA5A9|nr:Ig-like domain-containing protein [Brevibacillus borstelensis]
MNKKLVLSVLSTAVLTSMAASAMAKPSQGFYVGGEVDKYYSPAALLQDFKTNLHTILEHADEVVYVNKEGKAAGFLEYAEAADPNTVLKPASMEHFGDNVYTDVLTGTVYDPSKDSDVKPVPGTDLAVESVSAINGAQLKVKFTADVDRKSAETAGNYKVDVNGVSVVAAKLVDSKTVVVTLDPKTTLNLNQTEAKVTVEKVASAADSSKVIPAFSQKISFLDLTVPEAVSAKLAAPGKVEIFFSEPVTVADGTAFLLDGGKYSVAAGVDVKPETNSVIISTGTLSEGEHTVTVNGNGTVKVVDGVGLKVAKTDIKFNVANDVEAPKLLSAVAESQNSVVLTFDEKVVNFDKTDVYHTANVADYQAENVKEVEGSNGTKWEVTFKNPLPTGTVTIAIAKEAIQDAFGNKNPEILSSTVTVTADTVKPTITNSKFSDNTLTLTFSEEVDSTLAKQKSNYKVTDKDNKSVTGFTVDYSDKKTTLKFSADVLKEGATYKVEVSGIKDKAVVPNEMDKYTTSFTVTDVTPPTVESAVYNEESKKITVFFSEAIDGTDLLNKSKYTLKASNGGTEVDLPADASVAVGPNNTSVDIVLPEVIKDSTGKDVAANLDTIIVAQVRDLAGNKSKAFTELTYKGQTPGEISEIGGTASTVDTKTIKFAVNKPLKTIAAEDFSVKVGNTTYKVNNVDYVNKTIDGVYGSEITIKLEDAMETSAEPVVTVKADAKTVSVYGDKFAANHEINVEDAVAPAIKDISDDGKINGDDVLVNVVDGAVGSVTLTFTESLKEATVSLDDFEIDGHTIADRTFGNGGDTVTLVLKKPADVSETFTVRFVGAVSDLNGNVFEGKGLELTGAKVSQEDLDKIEAEKAKKAAIEAVNAAEVGTIADVLAQHKDVLKIDLEGDYAALKDKAPVHEALVGKKFTSVEDIKTAFDEAVEAQKEAEANPTNPTDPTNPTP